MTSRDSSMRWPRAWNPMGGAPAVPGWNCLTHGETDMQDSGFLPLLGDVHITEMEIQGRRALSSKQGSDEKNENFAIILSLSNEATTSSPLCRRRSVWQYHCPGIATSAATGCSSADDLALGQHHELDVAPGNDLSTRSPTRALRLPLLPSYLEADIVRAQALFAERQTNQHRAKR